MFKKITVLLIILVSIFSCSKQMNIVTVYTSLDQVFSEPVLKIFEDRTGIKVNAVYDLEAAKTTGLVNRLIAEKDNPQADVFWNSEVSRTIILKDRGVLAPYSSPSAQDIPDQFKDKDGYWAGFAARARVLIYNKKLIEKKDLPQSIFDFTKPEWKGRFCLAYPLFGTTATHSSALFVTLGDRKAMDFFKALKENGVVIVDGNSVTRDLVVEGKYPIGFTDTDDVNVAIEAGEPVDMFFPDKDGMGTLLIPNTVGLVKNGPHPENAKKLIDFLLSKEIESTLSFSGSLQMPVRSGVKTPEAVPDYINIKAMDVDFKVVADKMDTAMQFLQELFVR